MNKERQQSFSDSLHQLEQKFSDGGQPGESDAQIAEELVHLILEAVRRSRGVLRGTPEGNAADAATLAKMAGWDSDDPELLTAEKALRRLATGGGADAVALLKRAVSNRQQTVSNEQRRRASLPRKPDRLQELIERIVAASPKISAKKLERRLRNEIGNGVIHDMDDTEIILAYGKKTSVKISGLKHRLTRAKEKIPKAG
jgi:hypothetical protein